MEDEGRRAEKETHRERGQLYLMQPWLRRRMENLPLCLAAEKSFAILAL